MDSIIVQYNLEHLEHNNLEIELMFNLDIQFIDMVIVSHIKANKQGIQSDEQELQSDEQGLQSDEQGNEQNIQSGEQYLCSDEQSIQSGEQCLRSDSNEINIMLTLLNITIHTFINIQNGQFFVEFIVYNNKNNFVSCIDNPICCMTIEMDMLINLTAALEFINMPCIQNKLNASASASANASANALNSAENLALTKFMQFCSNFANILNIEKNNIDLMMASNHYFDTIFTEAFNSIASD